MKPYYTIDFKRTGRLYKYVNTLYKKGQLDKYLSNRYEREESEDERRKINQRRSALSDDFKNIDMQKVREAAIFYLHDGLIMDDFDAIQMKTNNAGYKTFIKKIMSLINADKELTKIEAKNQEELNKKINLMDASNNFKSQLTAFLDEESADDILNQLKERAQKIRKEFIVEQQHDEYGIGRALNSKRYNCHVVKQSILINNPKIKNLEDDKLDILDEVMNKALTSYLDANLSFDDIDKQMINKDLPVYKISKLSHMKFMDSEQYGIKKFLYDYMFGKGYDIADFNKFVFDFNNNVLTDENMTAKQKFDKFMLGFAENIFCYSEHHSRDAKENVSNVYRLAEVFNKMAEEKGVSLVELKELQDADYKNYFYNIYGSQYIADGFKEFEQNRIPYQKLNNGQVDTIHAEFQAKMDLYNEHMNLVKALQNAKPEKSFSIDMEVYRKNYNYLKNIHESRGFFRKLFNLGTHRQEARALKAYAKTFKEAFNIVGEENEKQASNMLKSRTPLIEDGNNIRFVSNSNYLDMRTKGTIRDKFIETIKKGNPADIKEDEENRLSDLEDVKEERTSIIVDEINKNNNKEVIENNQELVDFQLENDHYKITKEKYDAIMDYINHPDGMIEREPGQFNPDYVRNQFLKDEEPIKEKGPELVKDKEA